MTEIISQPLFIIFIICFFLHIFVYFFFYSKLAFIRNELHEKDFFPDLSVIIVAKNEDSNLKEFLPFVLKQDYPVFEVIVVDDQSEDDTEFVLKAFEKEYSNLRIVTIKEYIREYPGKKFAITLGIKKSIYDFLVFTDADCKPASNLWLRHIAAAFGKGGEIILGYSPYFRKKTLLNIFIQFETFYTAVQYFSFCLLKMPYMGVGRNLAYTKELFMKTGFSTHLHIPYGDDDLFVNKNATAGNVRISLNPESFVFSKAKGTFYKWKRQKIRHLKAGKEYHRSDKLWLGFIWLSQVLFYLSFISVVIFSPASLILWGFLALKIIISLFIYGKCLKRFNQIWLIYFIPIIEPIYHLFIVPAFSLFSFSSRRNVW